MGSGSFSVDPASLAIAGKVLSEEATALQGIIATFVTGASAAEGHLLTAANDHKYVNGLNQIEYQLGQLQKLLGMAAHNFTSSAANYSGADQASSIKG